MRGWISMAEEGLTRLREIRDELREIRELLGSGAVTPQRYMQGMDSHDIQDFEAQR